MCEITPRFFDIPHYIAAVFGDGLWPRGSRAEPPRTRHFSRKQYQAGHDVPGRHPGIQAQPGDFRLCYSRDVYCNSGLHYAHPGGQWASISLRQAEGTSLPLWRKFTHTSPKSRSVPCHVTPVTVRQDAGRTSPRRPPPQGRGDATVASPI